MTTLQTAQHWTFWGAAVIPIKARDKAPALKSWKPYQTDIPSDDQLRSWFTDDSKNIALVTGHNGLTVIDFDDHDVWMEWVEYDQKCALAGIVQTLTYQVETSKGRHVYVRLPEATKSRPLLKPDGSRLGIDIKSRGGYVLIPPSIHPSGAPYRAVNPGAPIWHIDTLSEILPVSMLTQADFQPSRVKRHTSPPRDIWDQAMNPTTMGPGTVDRIKAAYKLEDLLPVRQRTGADFYLTECPLHNDHNPSMWVKTDEQICGCYAGCTTKPLDVVNLYARVHDLSNREAIAELARGI
jgi:hypothetical protein